MTPEQIQQLLMHLIKQSAFEMASQEENYHEMILAVSYGMLGRAQFTQDLSEETLTQIVAMLTGMVNLGIYIGKTNFYEVGYEEFKRVRRNLG